MPPMGGQCLQPALGFLLVAFFLSLFAVGHSLNHLLPSAWREEAALGVMLRWDSVRRGLLRRAVGPGLAPHCCGEPANGCLAFLPWAGQCQRHQVPSNSLSSPGMRRGRGEETQLCAGRDLVSKRWHAGILSHQVVPQGELPGWWWLGEHLMPSVTCVFPQTSSSQGLGGLSTP